MSSHITKDGSTLSDDDANTNAQGLNDQGLSNETASIPFSIKVTKKPVPATPRGVLAE